MARRRLLRLILVPLAAGLLLAAGCGDDEDASGGGGSKAADAEAPDVPFANSPENGVADTLPEPKPAKLRIGLVNPNRATEVLTNIFDAAKADIEELGGEAIEYDAKLNPDAQVSQLQQLINQDVDAIAFVPIAPPELLGPVIKQAGQKKIPVVALEALPGKKGPLPGFAIDLWQRRDYMVYLQVKAARAELGAGAKVGQIGFAVPAPVFEFSEPRTEYWARQFDLEIVDKVESPNDTVEGGQRSATELLTKHPDIEGILGYNDEPAIGAALAARAAGRDDLKTFGINGSSLGRSSIESGRLTASVFFDPEAYGSQVATATYDAAQGAKLPPEVLVGEPVIITKDNVDEIGK
jgi:ABC-type sugar transport system substrate-binding protein